MPGKRRSRSDTTASTQSAQQRPASRDSTASGPAPTEALGTTATTYAPPVSGMYNQPVGAYPSIEMQQQNAMSLGENDVDPALAAWHHQHGSGATHQPQHALFPHQHLDSQQSFEQMSGVQYAESQASMPMPIEVEVRKKGGSSTATNDKELRELLTRSEGRSLKEVAQEVVATERTSRAEKTKQLFAMMWLKASCKNAKSSVPRSRVYTTYAERCATERVNPLNPASFGKLVRVIFPGLQTRRLGVRGESKYHYVDLALVDDQPDYERFDRRNSQVPEVRPTHSSRNSAVIDFNSLPRLPADAASFPVMDGAPIPPPQPQVPQQSTTSESASRGRLFAEPYLPGVNTRSGSTSHIYKQTLKFPPANDSMEETDTIELPNIHDYTPPKTDIDAAMSLAALYRSHCTSLVDCIRFCREKQFFRLYASFGGTLTVPVHKLFDHPAMAPWIRECDWLMYQKMTYYISQLTLSVVPEVVLRFLDTISKTLHTHITKIFAEKPLHVLEAKLEPATLFAGLLHRMLRVNQAAHAAAALLMIDTYRDQMWQDWVAFVNPKRIMESELPDCGYEETYKILTYDVRTLLQPLNTPTWIENGTPYQEAALALQEANFNAAISSESVIERIAGFLAHIPARYPGASTRTILQCISSIGTAALREITVENGTSYNPWWITKVFIDEMSLWLASLGGFLDHKPEPPAQGPVQNGPYIPNPHSRSHSGSEYRSRQNSMASPMLGSFGKLNGSGPNAGNGTGHAASQGMYTIASGNGDKERSELIF